VGKRAEIGFASAMAVRYLKKRHFPFCPFGKKYNFQKKFPLFFVTVAIGSEIRGRERWYYEIE